MNLFLRASALAAFTFLVGLQVTDGLPAGAGDVAVDIAFYNSRVDCTSQSVALNGVSFPAIYAVTSPRTKVDPTDVVYANPHNAISALFNATQVQGKIVLIDRGPIEYDVQAANAVAAGAAGIIVVNNVGDPSVPSMQQTTVGTGVPDVMISQNAGDALKAGAQFGPDGVATVSTQLSIVANTEADRLLKLNAQNGTISWSVVVPNDGSLAVDPGDFSVYTARGGHNYETDGFIYKIDNTGVPVWDINSPPTISLNSYCDFFYVTNVAVDAFSSNPGVVWSENGCFGALSKTDRATGAQQWSLLTYDIGKPSIDPTTGQIYAITNAGNAYDAETIYSITAGGLLSYASSCEGFTDFNPADGHLYRGGDASARGCGTTLSQLDTTNLGLATWTLDLSGTVSSVDGLAVQPWQGGYVYAASVTSSKIVVVDPVTQTVVTSFSTAFPPKYIAVDPAGGSIYVADDVHPTVIAYGPTGALLWINPNLGGTVTNLATARGLAGQPPVPVATAATTAATSVGSSSATLNGTVNPNGASTTVFFQYGTTTTYGSQTANQVFTGNSVQNATANVGSLIGGTMYHYRIVAKNAGGTTTGSDLTFTTAAATPTPTPTPTATPTPTPPCKAPTVKVVTTGTSVHKGKTVTITFTAKNPCPNTVAHFSVVTNAVSGVDFTLTDQLGQDATTTGQTTGPLTLYSIYTSRRKTLPISVLLTPDPSYYRGNTKVTVRLLPN
ncbi:MAG TPA: PA domain-containing protein [Chthoniobacterales bacterium]|nr:PA domain-containing protein [Chthoniobacterales bacterium]